MTSEPGSEARFAICVSNADFPVALEREKVYQVLPDPLGERYGMVRVIDETGDSCLYPDELFRPLQLSAATRARLLRAS